MINRAIAFATRAHEGQKRKGTKLPYIVHPLEVGTIVSHITEDEEVIAAAFLHDTVEDCEGVTVEVIEEHFGPRVARIVSAESADKSRTWMQRKGDTLEFLSTAKDSDILMVALGDKLSNARSIKRDYDRVGDNIWQRFNMKSKSMQAWYYKGLCHALRRLHDYPEYKEFCDLVEYVFKDIV